MSDFKIVKLVDPIVVQTNGVNASITGNTAGTAAVISSGTMYLAGGNNITLSQSQNTVSIVGGAGAGGGIAAAAGTQTGSTGTINFANSNGLTFGMSNSSQITGSYTVPSTAGLISAINVSGGTTSNNLSKITFADSNGISFGLNGSVLTGTVKTDYQTSGNYLTTARASNDAIGLNTAKTNVTWTVNSSGISLDGGAYITSQTNQNMSLYALGNTTQNSSTVLNASNLSFNAIGSITAGYSNGSIQISAPNALTTAMASNRGTDFVQANAAFNGTNASGTIASNNISVSVAAQTNQTLGVYGSSQTTGSASSGTHDARSLSVIGAGIVSVGNHSTSVGGTTTGVIISATQSNQALSGSNGSFAFQTATFGNLNGLSFYTSNGSLVGSHNGLTTARASNDAIGLNTAQSNVTWTANSSGLSLDARGYAGTGTSATNASITLNSNGLAVSVAAPGAAAENNWVNLLGANTAGNTTASGSTIGYSGINATLSGTNGSVVNISVPATSSLSATGGLNVSTNGSTLSIGMPFDAFYEPYPLLNPVSTTWAPGIGTWHFEHLPVHNALNSGRINALFSMGSTSAMLAASNGASFASNTTGGASWSFRFNRTVALYSRGAGVNSTRLDSIWSNTLTNGISQSVGVSTTNVSQLTVARSVSLQYVQSVETNGLYTTAGLGATHNASYASSNTNTSVHTSAISSIYNILSGAQLVPFGFNTTIPAGDYWLGIAYSTASTTAGTSVNGASIWPQINQVGLYGQSSMSHRLFGATASSTGSQFMPGHAAIYSAASSAPPATIAFTDLRSVASHVIPYVNFMQSVAS